MAHTLRYTRIHWRTCVTRSHIIRQATYAVMRRMACQMYHLFSTYVSDSHLVCMEHCNTDVGKGERGQSSQGGCGKEQYSSALEFLTSWLHTCSPPRNRSGDRTSNYETWGLEHPEAQWWGGCLVEDVSRRGFACTCDFFLLWHGLITWFVPVNIYYNDTTLSS